MGTKTIGITDDVYERLKARKREGESFTDVVDRLLDESTANWRDGFGTLATEEAEALEEIVQESRTRTGDGLSKRQADALDELAEIEGGDDTDETA